MLLMELRAVSPGQPTSWQLSSWTYSLTSSTLGNLKKCHSKKSLRDETQKNPNRLNTAAIAKTKG